MFFAFNDIPFILIIVIGIFLPEVYIRMHWPLHLLMSIRLITLVITCFAATIVELVFVPGSDFGIVFTRSFIFIGVSRMIMLSSHQIVERDQEIASKQGKQEKQK